MEFNIQGKVSFNVDFDVEVSCEDKALIVAKEAIKGYIFKYK